MSGEGGVDEATLTGESWPVMKAPGQRGRRRHVQRRRRLPRAGDAAGARERRGAHRAICWRRRSASATPWERTADRAARVLVPLVVVLAALAAGGLDARRRASSAACLVGIAVLVVACPCGLGIATPVADLDRARRRRRATA